jgi:hypothetical protein
MSDWRLELAPAEVVELRLLLADVIEGFADRPRRPGTEPVTAIVQLFPRPRSES